MKVTSEPIENRQVKLNIEIDAAEQEEYLDKTYKRLVKRVNVPGFRKGKAPRDILERHIGRDALVNEALDDVLPFVYTKALDEQQIEPAGRPQVEIVQTDPLSFNAVVPLAPEVKLGDYRSVRIPEPEVVIGEEEKEAALKQLREQQATLAPVERPVQMGDVVTIDVEGIREGETFPISKDQVYELVEESPLPLPGFSQNLVGVSAGEEKNFDLSYPEDYERKEIAGKDYTFKVAVKEVKEKQLPELNDEFAASFESENMEQLKEKIESGLKERAEQQAQSEYERQLVDEVVKLSEISYPPVVVDDEIDRMIEEEKKRFMEGEKGLENYLNSVNKTMDQHREELRPIAEERVVRSLALSEVAKAEEVKAENADIEEEINRMVGEQGEDEQVKQHVEQFRKMCEIPQVRESIENTVVTRKTLDKLKEIANGKAEDIENNKREEE